MDSPFRWPFPGDAQHSAADNDSSRWSVADLIDFDYYVEADERDQASHPGARGALAGRDRALYLDRIKNRVAAAEHTPEHRRAALRHWLGARRRGEEPDLRPLLPGASFARGQRLLTLGMGLAGLIGGGLIAAALLGYDGQHPVNISWYLFVLVIAQMLLIGVTVGAWALRRARPVRETLRDISLLARLIQPLFGRLAAWIQRQRLAQAPPEIRERARARTGLLRAHVALYGNASYLPILIPVQVFGIGFNIGAILITIMLQWFSDLAFGWETALDVTPATIHGLAHLIAWPWSWLFGEGSGVPTLAEVAGTRIYLKDPLTLLAAEHLRSWRWFLVLAVISYGLLPRLLLLGVSAWTQRRVLDALPFTHQRTQALYARLVTPSLDTATGVTGSGPAMPIPAPLKPLRAPPAAPRPEPVAPPGAEPAMPDAAPLSESAPAPLAGVARVEPAPASEPVPAPRPPPEPNPPPEREPAPQPPAAAPPGGPRIDADACVLLLQIDIADVLEERDHARLQELLRAQSGWRVAATVTFGGGSAMAEQALQLIASGQWRAPPARVALLADGSQPPITEMLRFLRRVRASAGEQAQVLLSLVGDPDGDDPLPPLPDFDFNDWRQKIEQLGDPYLRLDRLVPSMDEAS